MRMTVRTSEESSNLLCGQIVASAELMAPNLELSLGHGEASVQVSSSSKIPSSSVSSSNYHGDGTSLHLSLSPSYPFPEGEASCADPMITEQQDAETPIVDPLSFPQLINFLR